MTLGLTKWLVDKISMVLAKEHDAVGTPICDFERICFEIRPCDVLLVEGRSRVSEVIKTITQSPWTHSALYIGRLHDIENPNVREHIQQFYDGDPNQRLLLEALLGEGTVIRPITAYEKDHLRICRPKGLSRADAQKVISFATKHLGYEYDVRQLLDLARFMFPYGILPRRWRSSLFQHNAGPSTRTVCSSLIAAAFSSVHFPIMPVVQHTDQGGIRLYKRNFRLYTPRDFDYSPYFEIIKYPYLGLEDMAIYQKLPWDPDGAIYDGDTGAFYPQQLVNNVLQQQDGESTNKVAVLDESEFNLLPDQEPAPTDLPVESTDASANDESKEESPSTIPDPINAPSYHFWKLNFARKQNN